MEEKYTVLDIGLSQYEKNKEQKWNRVTRFHGN